MTYEELTKVAAEHVAAHPEATPVELFIHGFLAGAEHVQASDAAKGERGRSDEILNLFNTICPSSSKIRSLSDGRRRKVRLRMDEMRRVGDPVDVFRTVFGKMQASPFLRGENKRGWKASFDWIIVNDSNWLKVYEGQYDESRDGGNGVRVNDLWD